AGDSATMKCNATNDRVWVYDSLTSFDVSAKLKCGETVEITGRVKGYVKIRAANGAQGYVPESTFPDLPPYVDPNDSQAGVSIAKRVAPRAAVSAAASTPSMASNISAPPPAAAPVSAPAVVVALSPAPTPAPAVRTVAEIASAPVAVTSISVVAAPSTPAVSASAKSTPAPSPSRKSTPAAVPASKPQPPAPAAPAATSHAPALTSTSATSNTISASPAPSKMANTKSAAAPPQPSGAHPAPTPSVPTPAVPTPTKPLETSVIVQPQPVHEIASVHTVAATESDEYPDYQPENASADPACRLFFSAYGISPAQAKWIAQNRKKQFSSICPAPDVSRVDFVIIFTHDVDFFGSTLPTPVHTDHNGFSDFSPMTMIDTALVPMSEADKSHREYVWVFKMQRGNFDPSKFSPRKRPQFTKTESHAPTRTVEEAFRYIESGGPSQ
ncbi:MAG: hypothetical protein WBQ04_03975, partial [Candidatus Acidiferrales bacterium]